MRSRVPASERTSQRIEQLINALEAQEESSSLSQLGLRKIIEELLEAEVSAYLFADGIAERLHGGQRREAVLCAWGITTEGQKVLLHLSPGTKEDTESCRAFFQDLKRRGLGDPLLVATASRRP